MGDNVIFFHNLPHNVWVIFLSCWRAGVTPSSASDELYLCISISRQRKHYSYLNKMLCVPFQLLLKLIAMSKPHWRSWFSVFVFDSIRRQVILKFCVLISVCICLCHGMLLIHYCLLSYTVDSFFSVLLPCVVLCCVCFCGGMLVVVLLCYWLCSCDSDTDCCVVLLYYRYVLRHWAASRRSSNEEGVIWSVS